MYLIGFSSFAELSCSIAVEPLEEQSGEQNHLGEWTEVDIGLSE